MMAADIHNYCKQCQTCQACNMVTWAPQGQLYPLPVPDYCQQHATMDLIICLPKTDHGIDAIITFVDRILKYTYFVAVTTSISTDDLAQVFLSTVVAWHGVPECHILDRDNNFVSAFWKGLISALGAQVALSAACNYPQGLDLKVWKIVWN